MKYIVLFISLFITIGINGQSIALKEVNESDSLGRKTGIWISDYGDVSCYRNGELNGSEVFFRKNDNDSTIYALWLFNNKEKEISGTQIFFQLNGKVGTILADVTPNVDFIGAHRHYTKESIFPYQSYCYEFNEKGLLIAEGWAILGEDLIMDDERVGIWKYYGEDGKVELVDFSKDYGDHNPYL